VAAKTVKEAELVTFKKGGVNYYEPPA